jgi:hypothetical protein
MNNIGRKFMRRRIKIYNFQEVKYDYGRNGSKRGM